MCCGAPLRGTLFYLLFASLLFLFFVFCGIILFGGFCVVFVLYCLCFLYFNCILGGLGAPKQEA